MSAPFDPVAAADILLRVRAGAARPAGLPVTPPDVAAAYAVQGQVLRRLGGRVSWKMAMLGGRDRQTAAMPASEVFTSGATVAGLPRDAAIEVETAFVLGAGLRPDSDPSDALAAVAEVRLAFEIVGSRYADRTAVPPLEAMADSFSSAAIVLGDEIADWPLVLDMPLDLTLVLDGRPVASPEQTPTLAETTDFLIWLATHAAAQGLPLSAGDVVITGARIGPVPLRGATQASASGTSARVNAGLSYLDPGPDDC